jgi:hypothetical protein
MRNSLTPLALAAFVLWTGHSNRVPSATAAESGPGALAAAHAGDDWQPPMTNDGWLDLRALLVPSDRSRSAGRDTRKSRARARDIAKRRTEPDRADGGCRLRTGGRKGNDCRGRPVAVRIAHRRGFARAVSSKGFGMRPVDSADK